MNPQAYVASHRSLRDFIANSKQVLNQKLLELGPNPKKNFKWILNLWNQSHDSDPAIKAVAEREREYLIPSRVWSLHAFGDECMQEEEQQETMTRREAMREKSYSNSIQYIRHAGTKWSCKPGGIE